MWVVALLLMLQYTLHIVATVAMAATRWAAPGGPARNSKFVPSPAQISPRINQIILSNCALLMQQPGVRTRLNTELI